MFLMSQQVQVLVPVSLRGKYGTICCEFTQITSVRQNVVKLTFLSGRPPCRTSRKSLHTPWYHVPYGKESPLHMHTHSEKSPKDTVVHH